MTLRPAVLATIVAVVLSSGADAQTTVQRPSDTPDFKVQIWAWPPLISTPA